MASATYSHHAYHNPRSSFNTLSDLLADLDEHQVQLLLEELNHTTSSNMAVSQAVNLFEGFDSTISRPQAPTLMLPPTQLDRSPSTTQRLRLSLKTIFKHAPTSSSSNRRSIHRPSTATASSSARSSPTSYRRISRPVFNLPQPASVSTTDLHALLTHFSSNSDASSSSSSSSPASSFKTFRRLPSTIDMALAAERSAMEPECLGLLGMLEPRPVTSSGVVGHVPTSPSATMDSIFAVMENA